MREELEKIHDIRRTFTATFKRYGTKTNWKGYSEKTILFVDVTINGEQITDHIWFTMTKGFEELGELKKETLIQFDARVKEYTKGYNGDREGGQLEHPIEKDYRLSHPTKIKILKETQQKAFIQQIISFSSSVFCAT